MLLLLSPVQVGIAGKAGTRTARKVRDGDSEVPPREKPIVLADPAAEEAPDPAAWGCVGRDLVQVFTPPQKLVGSRPLHEPITSMKVLLRVAAAEARARGLCRACLPVHPGPALDDVVPDGKVVIAFKGEPCDRSRAMRESSTVETCRRTGGALVAIAPARGEVLEIQAWTSSEGCSVPGTTR